MTASSTTPAATGSATSGSGADPAADLSAFLESRTRVRWAGDADLFTSGGVTSLFALELVVHIESAFGVEIGGDDLVLDNFRTIDAMAALVDRLRKRSEGE